MVLARSLHRVCAFLAGCVLVACEVGTPDGDEGLPPGASASATDSETTPCVTGQPELLPDFGSLMAALEGGEQVRVVLDYDRCSLDGSPGPDAVGGMSIDNWEHFAAGVVGNTTAYVATSQTQLVQFGAGGAALNYVRVRVYEDGAVQVTAQYLDPTTYEVTMNEVFDCRIDGGDAVGGAAFLAPPRVPADGE